MLYTAFAAVWTYASEDIGRFMGLGLKGKSEELALREARRVTSEDSESHFLNDAAFAHVFLCLAMTVYCLTCMHVQPADVDGLVG
ncbi:hypothetical protein HDU82_005968 [Entophlyctis luteolus]|nr:hypothetical protein HDU82_005968 [Entophlyctis luteolus]